MTEEIRYMAKSPMSLLELATAYLDAKGVQADVIRDELILVASGTAHIINIPGRKRRVMVSNNKVTII